MICLHCSKEIKEEECIAIVKERTSYHKYSNNEISVTSLGSVRFHVSCFEYMAGKDLVRQIDYDTKKKEKIIDDIFEECNKIRLPRDKDSILIFCDRCDDFLCDGS